jgi:hypothetical protein
MLRAFLLALLALMGTVALAPATARACASCACGDPLLTTLGLELPFAGRLRISAQASTRSESAGAPLLDEMRGQEQRLSLALAWSPLDRLTLGLALPLVHRSAVEVSGRRHLGFGLGDVELRGRWVAADLRGSGMRHIVSVHAGADLPVMPLVSDGSRALPIEAQPGSGAFSGLLGASYALHLRPWSFYASLSGRLSTPGFLDELAGPAALGTLSAQLQVHAAWALGLSLDGRLDGPAKQAGIVDPHSGGLLAVIAPTVLFSPFEDWLLTAALRVPINDGLTGLHHEDLSFALGVTCDL